MPARRALRVVAPLGVWRSTGTAAERAARCLRFAPLGTRSLAGAAARPRFDLPRVRRELFECWSRAEAMTERARAPRQAQYCSFTFHDLERAYLADSAAWHWLDGEMSSNIAGETGAVSIYSGALAAIALRGAVGAPLPEVAREFCHEHREAESAHLRLLESVVPASKRTRLLPLWRLAGWGLGFVPTVLGGAPALFRTVEAVETFVEEHYQQQIVPLSAGRHGECAELCLLYTSPSPRD